jgi:hypothetical protein
MAFGTLPTHERIRFEIMLKTFLGNKNKKYHHDWVDVKACGPLPTPLDNALALATIVSCKADFDSNKEVVI